MELLKSVFSFKGRITRLSYFISLIVFFVGIWFTGAIQGGLEVSGTSEQVSRIIEIIIALILIISFYWFILAQSAKRCHDLGNSGFYQIIPLYFFIMLFADGKEGPNEFGEDPKYRLTESVQYATQIVSDKICPNCKLHNPASTILCDCGYNFQDNVIEIPLLKDKKQTKKQKGNFFANKSFGQAFSNKLKALYLVWCFLNTILFVFSFSSKFSLADRIRYFYPFMTDGTNNNNFFTWFYDAVFISALRLYDISELIIYILSPILIAYTIYSFRKPSN